MKDFQRKRLPGPGDEIEHSYGDRVHLLSTPHRMTWLSAVCAPETGQPRLNRLVENLYRDLVLEAVSREFRRRQARIKTRMYRASQRAVWEGEVLDPETRVVCVGVARAGILPAHVCFETLTTLLRPANVRLDYLFLERRTNRHGEVVGVSSGGAKIGGPIDGAWILLPDPMGATGASVREAIRQYRRLRGRPLGFLSLHLIVTPEFLRHLLPAERGLRVYAVRLDRGLSSKTVLRTMPGGRWREERGLNRKGYIIPGAGGMGEVLSNATS